MDEIDIYMEDDKVLWFKKMETVNGEARQGV